MGPKWKFSRRVAAIGSGKHPCGSFPEKTPWELAMYAIKDALDDSRISKDEIDVILPESVFVDSIASADLIWSRLVEELGLGGRIKMNVHVSSGGSTGISAIHVAAGLIATEQAETVLLVHMDKLASGETPERIRDLFALYGMYEEWEFPYGLNYNTIGGMLSHRFMYDTGTTQEELASLVVSNRKWAALNPNALLRRHLTLEEVLQSKMIASPQTSRMCNIVCDGATAIVFASAEKARKVTKSPVYLLGMGGVVTHFSLMTEPDVTKMGWEKAGKEAYESAGVGPQDIDIAELYDSYPVLSLMQLEALGFCERGKAGRFVKEGNTWPGGKLPMTTNGGMICEGHLGGGGGTSLVAETIRQLKGECGERQVKDAKIALLTGVGGQYMDAQVTIWGR